MKIWILKPVDGLPNGDNPWDPWYDKCFGMVVRAESEEEARQFAHESASDENRGEFLRQKIANTEGPWLDPKYSTCDELSEHGEPGVLLQDIHSA